MHTFPARFRPVLPIRCTIRTGLLSASKLTMRSTSPMSRPSSAMHVATRQLNSPEKNAFTTAWKPRAAVTASVLPSSSPLRGGGEGGHRGMRVWERRGGHKPNQTGTRGVNTRGGKVHDVRDEHTCRNTDTDAPKVFLQRLRFLAIFLSHSVRNVNQLHPESCLWRAGFLSVFSPNTEYRVHTRPTPLLSPSCRRTFCSFCVCPRSLCFGTKSSTPPPPPSSSPPPLPPPPRRAALSLTASASAAAARAFAPVLFPCPMNGLTLNSSSPARNSVISCTQR